MRAMEAMTEYNDGGKTLPNVYLIFGKQFWIYRDCWMRRRYNLWQKWNWLLPGKRMY